MVRLAEHALLLGLRLRGFRSRWIDTAAGRLHVLEAEGAGELPPLVLMHGLSAAGVHFRPILKSLLGRHERVVIPDLPGHGFSDVPDTMSTDLLYRSMLVVLDTVVTAPSILVGNSLGGVGSVRYALLRPERVRGLLLLAPGGASMPPEELEIFLGTFALDSHRDALDFVDRLFPVKQAGRHVLAWGARRTFARGAIRDLIAGIGTEDLLSPSELARLQVPTLVLWGGGDGVLSMDQLDYWREHLPASARCEVDEAFGHCAFLDRPGLVARRILAFAEDLAVRA